MSHRAYAAKLCLSGFAHEPVYEDCAVPDVGFKFAVFRLLVFRKQITTVLTIVQF